MWMSLLKASQVNVILSQISLYQYNNKDLLGLVDVVTILSTRALSWLIAIAKGSFLIFFQVKFVCCKQEV